MALYEKHFILMGEFATYYQQDFWFIYLQIQRGLMYLNYVIFMKTLWKARKNLANIEFSSQNQTPLWKGKPLSEILDT